MTIDTLLRQAVVHHQQGEFAQAEALYAQVLRHDPDNFDALHLSGVSARQRGDAAQALDLIGRAIALDPSRAIAHCNFGAALQDAGRDADALASYEHALRLQPDYPMALCNRGNALRRLGRLDAAIDSYTRALALSPRYPEALCHRALALQQQGRHDAALDDFGAALAIRSGYVDAIHGAAVSLLALGEASEALQGYVRVLQLQPDHVDAWCGRAGILLRDGQFDAAIDDYRNALAVRPTSARARLGLANALRTAGRHDEAIAAYRQAKDDGADSATVDYLLAALGAGKAPDASPPDYVAALFDQYAPRFDRHLVGELAYRTPQLLAQALARHMPAADKDVLDLGCGTGLCGPLLRPFARRLEGVDLSPAMLERAGAVGVYDALACADILRFLGDDRRQWDVLAAADVLVYLGDLAPLFAAARGALRGGGLFAFSVEALEAGTYALRPSGRYAHAAPYLEALAREHGFALRELAPCTLRRDSGGDVAGLLVLLARA
ncbi:putative TPR repeat methyltransferase [Pseudoduganella flava]|uniref:Putative TPR repeat methyltransferase n=1 Tax=Pseudoduganella flava TaxID=871742 RepID=A0A562PMD8_9BURK|nr:tetratricopeptide repeat protein [Pseudoduganella flava]QGZ40956.1 tetratricopeptide repeat protein [Pseudoduganella flava]TWI45360.1 putative TPR repeat methyltransferase [Pseudoduganella flava]